MNPNRPRDGRIYYALYYRGSTNKIGVRELMFVLWSRLVALFCVFCAVFCVVHYVVHYVVQTLYKRCTAPPPPPQMEDVVAASVFHRAI